MTDKEIRTAEAALDKIESLTPEEADKLTRRLKEKGGKFRLFAEVLMGIKPADTPEWGQFKE